MRLPRLPRLPRLARVSSFRCSPFPVIAALTLGTSLVGCGDSAPGRTEDASADDAHTASDAKNPDDAGKSEDASSRDAPSPDDARAPDDASGPEDAGVDAAAPPDATVDASDGSTVDATVDASDGAAVDASNGATIDASEGETVDASDGAAARPPDASPDDDAGPDASRTDSGAPSDDAGPWPEDGGELHDGESEASDASDGGWSCCGGGDDAGWPDGGGGGGKDTGTPGDAGTIVWVAGVQVSTLAGAAASGTQDGTGSAARFNNPTGMAIDPQGNLVVADYGSSLVRLVTPQGVVTTIAWAKDFVGPFATVVASDGAFYVETDYNPLGVKTTTSGTIWRVTPLGDGGLALPVTIAQGFGRPRGLAPLAGGDLFLSDRSQDIVETLSVGTGIPAFVAGTLNTPGFQDGTGAGAEFSSPLGAATLPDGSVLVADSVNNVIRRVETSGAVTTFAGDGLPGVNDGPRLGAEFDSPRDVAIDAAGVVYVSDAGNHRIRRIRVDGNVDTLAGDGTAGFNDGSGPGAEFYGQEGLDVTPDGHTVYVADGNSGDGSSYNRVRAIAIP